MTYRINPDVELIKSPIVVHVEDRILLFDNGEALADEVFDKNFGISRIEIEQDRIAVYLEENKRINEITWVGEEAVSLF